MVTSARTLAERGSIEAGRRILVITSDEGRAAALCDLLESEGLGPVGAVSDARRALPGFREMKPDLPRAFDSPWTRDQAIEFIRGRSGHFFDPSVVAAFLEVCDRGEDLAPDQDASTDPYTVGLVEERSSGNGAGL